MKLSVSVSEETWPYSMSTPERPAYRLAPRPSETPSASSGTQREHGRIVITKHGRPAPSY